MSFDKLVKPSTEILKDRNRKRNLVYALASKAMMFYFKIICSKIQNHSTKQVSMLHFLNMTIPSKLERNPTVEFRYLEVLSNNFIFIQ